MRQVIPEACFSCIHSPEEAVYARTGGTSPTAQSPGGASCDIPHLLYISYTSYFIPTFLYISPLFTCTPLIFYTYSSFMYIFPLTYILLPFYIYSILILYTPTLFYILHLLHILYSFIHTSFLHTPYTFSYIPSSPLYTTSLYIGTLKKDVS